MDIPLSKVSIIGTAGRNSNNRLSSEMFDKMVDAVNDIIREHFSQQDRDIILVSGGSAWSDHIAVMLFLDGSTTPRPGAGGYSKLKLYTPCPFENDKFKDTGIVDWRTNPGGTLNYYHSLFSKEMETNTLLDIKKAIEYGAEIDYSCKTFHSRNTKVAQSDIVIALTWGDDEPIDGGTLDTWKKVPNYSYKYHISLKSLMD